MTPREMAQLEAEATYKQFLVWCKRTVYIVIAGLLLVASCNFGVETGPNATGSGYNGEQYAPENLSTKK